MDPKTKQAILDELDDSQLGGLSVTTKLRDFSTSRTIKIGRLTRPYEVIMHIDVYSGVGVLVDDSASGGYRVEHTLTNRVQPADGDVVIYELPGRPGELAVRYAREDTPKGRVIAYIGWAGVFASHNAHIMYATKSLREAVNRAAILYNAGL